MNTNLRSTFRILHSAFLLLPLALLTTTPRAPAQTGWGTALSFNGVSNQVQLGSVPLANSSFTIEFWAQQLPNGLQEVVSQGTMVANQLLQITFNGNTVTFGFWADDLVGSATVDTSWHHWAFTYDATTRARNIFKDGVVVAQDTASANYQGSGPTFLSGFLGTSQFCYAGVLDDVRVWNVARSQADIQANMLHPLTGTESNLVAYWKFDEGSGTTAFDATGHGFNGTLVNGPSWVASTVPQAPAGWGTALSCDGVDDYVDMGAGGPVLGANFTEEAWIYPQITDSNWHGVLGYQPAAGVSYRSPSIFTLGPATLQVGFGTGSGWTNYLAPNVLQTNAWNHVAATYDGTYYRAYVNGQLILSANCTAIPYSTPVRYIGTVDKYLWFPGRIDEVRIWNVARSQADIQTNMVQPLTGYEPGLVAYYRFDEGGGITAYDASPNHNNGTLNNRPVRVPSTITPPPFIQLFGANPMTNQFNVPFVDPGATAGAGFVSLDAQGGFPQAGYTLALKADGTLMGWDPQSGVDPYANATNVVAVAAGAYHNLALLADGSVTGWGDDSFGENTTPDSVTNGVVAVSAGQYFSLALKADGTVVGWGFNADGEATGVASLTATGLVVVAGQTLSNVVAISAGFNHSLALRADGSVVVWGDTSNGEGNIPPSASSGVVAISAGGFYSLALKADGSVVAWGWNGLDQTNVPASASSGVVGISAGRYPYAAHCLALKADGSAVAWGDNSYGQTNVPASAASGVAAVATASYYGLALKTDGSIVAWGDGSSQQGGPPLQRTSCPGLTVTGTVNVEVPGTYTLTYTVTNALGIVGTATRTVVVPPDTTPPVLPAQVVLTALPGSCQAALTPITATDISDPNPMVTCVPPVGTLLPLGITNIVCVATDASGNSTTGAVQVVVNGSGQTLAPAGEVWTPSLTVTQGGEFAAIACSTDGTRLVAVQYSGQIYNSTDGGLTWAARDTNRYWSAVAASADGTRMVAADYGDPISGGFVYTSTDSGATWTPRLNPEPWVGVASSADGTRLLAVAESDRSIWVSTDSGTNWTQDLLPTEMEPCFVATSADGSRVAVASTNEFVAKVCTSADGGSTWAQMEAAPGTCSALAMSADGNTIVAGQTVVPWQAQSSVWISTNAGTTWTPQLGVTNNWYSVASSADGTKLVAAGGYVDSNTNYDGSIYFSGDSGATWTNAVTSASWSCLASSADGSKLFAGTFDGQLYRSVPTLAPPPPTFTGATNQVVALGANGTVVNFNVTATVNYQCQSNSDLPVTCTPPSGSTFPAGTNVVTCVAIDSYGLTYTTNFTVEVLGNQAPTDILLSNSTVPALQPVGTTVGTLSAVGQPGDAYSFALVPGAGDTDNDSFAIAGNSLQTAVVLDDEPKSSYSIRVRATETGGLSLEEVFTVTVNPVNHAPVLDVSRVPALGLAGINAGAPAGAVGTAVTNLVDIGGPLSDVSDEDPGAVTGVAITGADTNEGTWYYTVDGGTNWNLLGTNSESSALLLAAAPGSRVYFQPQTSFIGTVPAALSFRAWDQTSGTNGGTADTTSNGWTNAFSTAVGAASQEVGWGYAVSLNGTNQYVQMPTNVWFSNDFTIEAWVYERSYNNWSRVVDFGNGTNDNVYLALSTGTTGQPRLAVYVGASPYYIIAPGPIPLNQWVHLAATLRNNTATLYTNGVMAISGPVTPPNAVNRTNNYIGRSNWAADSYANAIFDEVRIWNVALTQAQIANNLLTTLAGNEPGLVAYYRFDEGSGLTVHDATANHLDGQLINGPVWVPSTVPQSLTPTEFASGFDTIQYQGYWPGGVSLFADTIPPVLNLVVSGLSGNIQPGGGTPGLRFTDDTYDFPLTATFDGGDWGIITSGGNAPGILVTSVAGNGYHGENATYDLWPPGYSISAGGNGGSAGSVTINSQGDITTGGASAPGILAQSTGGTGGNGGNGGSDPVSGCWGGSGGNGGQVVVQDNGGSISTANNNSHGILALSLGGGGGIGGDNGTSADWGGQGGTGGNGGGVSVGGVGSIATTGDNSSGILAVSQAGQGGIGGSGGNIGRGGEGGIGGAAGAVNVDGSWSITTRGTNAPGISANSLGGDGGRPGKGGSIWGGGGAGGSSGNGGMASVEFGPGASGSGGTIETFGQDSHGIFAQSVGGFAGNGASGSSPVFSSSGGDGGSAGNGGSASIINSGQVTTHGQGADALFAESVGGGGGSSGSGSGWFGGNSGTPTAGGNGGAVSVVNSGAVRTEGYNARGIFAQSVGGGGGNCGYTVGLISIGDSGGKGGNGGSVNVANTGIVTTTNSDSTAIFAQSTGGGGGTGGGSGALGVGFSLAVGGSGGGGGSGGSVTVNSGTNSITTQGTNSHGIFAQSVGGGGGRGGYAISGSVSLTGSESISVGGTGGGGGNGGNVVVMNGSAITTQGTNSHGIFAQSVGGGGGSGGFSFAGSIGAVAGALSIGGRGNIGGSGDSVTVINTGTINTTDDRSYGILAQSVGGGGGDGGFSAAGAVGGVALPVSMGGQGGAGGNANAVTLDNSGAITTLANDSHGIFAQSVGGGGGSGGFSLAAGAGTYAGSLSFGGSGAGGGSSGPVTVNSSGAISTGGDRSYGILAQSVGGGGGDGGFSVAGAFSGAASAPLSFGGSAAGGGSAGNVAVNSQSQITTVGDDSHAIFAQSVGGGGGSGGFSVSGAVSGGATIGAAFGGSGGGGASAGNVTVTTSNTISTAGNRAYGILAQSIGGGGGDGGVGAAGGIGGVATVSLGMGGKGGAGGVGGNVVVTTVSSITTTGANAHAVFAQSVGGGGGSGGFSVAGGISGSTTVSAGIGGTGGSGAGASSVTVTATGATLQTSGDRSYGVLAQSVGGGGGDGGFSVAGGIGGDAAINLGLGGLAGVGGNGAGVTVTSGDAISTAGDNAHGIFAQSVGGGGGSGGFSIVGGISGGGAVGVSLGGGAGGGGAGGDVVVNTTNQIQTAGNRAYGILAQSIGGGGGDGGFSVAGGIGGGGPSVSLGLGGRGGAGGVGGNVTVNAASSITTAGTNAHAIFAQSVGGGGGSGGFSIVGNIADGPAVSAAIGGKGGTGADAGNVTVTSTGAALQTQGDRSYGLLAQSVGGGGGDGGFSVAGGISTGPAVSLGLGGSGGVAGNGAAVAVTNSSAITTHGQDSHGLFVQSVGGGGGSGGFSVAGGISSGAEISAAIGGGAGGGGKAGDVVLQDNGNISTSGDRAYGILAQSVGGGGGDGGFSVAGGLSSGGPGVNLGLGGSGGSGGVGGAVTVDVGANTISTSGSNAHGIFAQSVGGGGGSGGFSVAGSISLSGDGALSATLGGQGGGGANASNVVVTSAATISTAGDRSYGILAQSVGGGGGDGGFSFSATGSKGPAIALSLGGNGSTGGVGRAVSVINNGNITTAGAASYGVLAQSVGGGGGSGGMSGDFAFDANSLLTNSRSVSVGASLGGSGGGGGSADAVTVSNTGSINTLGDGSHGIMAQSVGGGGGAGGASLSLMSPIGTNSSDSVKVNAAIGGSGGVGGNGSNVVVFNAGFIETTGTHSYGVLAQSVGGGGGDGGDATVKTLSLDTGNLGGGPQPEGNTNGGSKSWNVDVSIGIGGAGGSAGDGGKVSVMNISNILTGGAQSHGIFAQSVGGGGGTGGANESDVGGGGGAISVNVNVGVGGNGGVGGSADAVTVNNQGSITTLGDASHGIVAQSIGGGGGVGGASVSTAGSAGTNSSVAVNLTAAVGGQGGVAGNGGQVSVVSAGKIDTSGEGSYGILAQSIGGGGGDGGNAQVIAGSAGESGSAPSSPGSGGTNAPSKSVSVDLTIGAGGGAGAGGSGGSVVVTNLGDIITRSNRSHAIVAQSIGGGGGTGGASTTDAGSSSGDISVNLNLGLGGKGGAGGSADTVTVNNQGSITTLGDASHGIVAQSIGGGGGVGGASVSTAGSAGTNSSVAVNLTAAVGGQGGVAGNGSQVSVVSGGKIDTSGEGSYGILAQSIGGGGGDGGNAQVIATNASASGSPPSSQGSGDTNAPSKSVSVDLTIGAGGGAGAGGSGGSVVVTNLGDIITRSNQSHAIVAQSIGGGGGTGGASTTDAGSSSGDISVNLNVGLGGKGGAGGSADTVTVNNQGSITTLGDASHGILAQSIGGGGGAGGASISTPSSGGSGSNNTVNLTATIGGSAANGGSGSNVLVTSSGQIQTSGQGSSGIFAQSVGGGGGDGGNAQIKGSSLQATNSPPGTNAAGNNWSVNLEVGLGGTAGAGGNGGSVTVTNSGSISTSNAQSHAIFAQSVGGGGGTGGASTTEMGGSDADTTVTLTVGLGGKGGSGGAAGTVVVNNESTLTTWGDGSHGIVAQSIGGGGGMGGASVTTPASGSPNATVNLTATLGGQGGVAGNGGNILVTSEGQIGTSGQASYGILAQSIGGGGGNAGISQAPDSTSTNWSLNLTLGSRGGAAGKGGAVTLTNQGAITTLGNDSHGVLLQSIGGGGGNAGSAHSGEPQSFQTLNITVGGNGGSGNDGGAVSMANSGSITTHGDGSMGVLAQSIGGGGGVGGTAGIGRSGTIGIGGSGGAAGNGAAVSVAQAGDINTFGVAAQGIVAQSIGGGGGIAGNVDGGLGVGSLIGVAPALAQSGGSAGNGGAVSVASSGDITTRGTGANAIFAQSVGGGGGLAGDPGVGLSFAGSVGGAGSGGAVSVTHTGNITTMGDASYGIFAQSAGGSNGFGGTVDITLAGNVTAQGADSVGIFAQSVGLNGGSNILINIQSGTVQGGSGSGVGVRIEDGANNTLINHGAITNASGSAGTAIEAGAGPNVPLRVYRVKVESSGTNIVRPQVWISRGAAGQMVLQFSCVTNQTYAIEYTSDLRSGGWTEVPSPVFTFPAPGMGQWVDDGTLTSGNDTIENYGTVIGSVDLGTGLNAFDNYLGATLNLGSMGLLNLGAGNVLTNYGLLTGSGTVVGNVFDAGTFSPGNSASSLTIDGNMNLLAGANLTFDLDGTQQGSTYDFIHVTNSVSFLGTLSLSLDSNFVPAATNTFTLMEFGSESGLFDNVVNGGRLATLDGSGSFRVNYTTNSLVLDDYQPGTNALRITSLSPNASGQMVLQFSCVTNQIYVIESTTNFNRGVWTAVPSPVFTWPGPGIGQWIDDGTLTGGLKVPFRCYRVRLQLATPP